MIGEDLTYRMDFVNWVDGLRADYGRDATSLDLFEWVIDRKYEELIQQSLEYFGDRADLLNLQVEEIEWELDYLLKYFEEVEEYEKCSRLMKLKKEIEYNIKSFLS